MRLSIRESDPGYDARACQSCTVFVDGVDVTGRCYTADEEEGKVWCFKHNELGQTFVDPDNEDKAAEEVLTGTVLIVLNSKLKNGYDPHSCN